MVISYLELFSIYNNLLSTALQIKRLYEDWEFGRQKEEADMAYHWIRKSASKVYDLILDEYPEFEADIQSSCQNPNSDGKVNE